MKCLFYTYSVRVAEVKFKKVYCTTETNGSVFGRLSRKSTSFSFNKTCTIAVMTHISDTRMRTDARIPLIQVVVIRVVVSAMTAWRGYCHNNMHK